MIEITDWARDILLRAVEAARRFNPRATVRIVRSGPVVKAVLAESPAPGDQPVDVDGVFVERGLEGLIDIEEPHDQIVLRPPGSTPNPRPK